MAGALPGDDPSVPAPRLSNTQWHRALGALQCWFTAHFTLVFSGLCTSQLWIAIFHCLISQNVYEMISIESLMQKTGNGLEAVKMVEASHHSFTGINHFLLAKYRDHNNRAQKQFFYFQCCFEVILLLFSFIHFPKWNVKSLAKLKTMSNLSNLKIDFLFKKLPPKWLS